MSDPSFALQKSVFAALVSSEVCSGRVYDRVPKNAVHPYCTIGDDTLSDSGNSCWDQSEAYVTVHIWSREVGRSEVKMEAGKAKDALNLLLPLDGPFKIEIGQWESTRFVPSPDALSAHAVLTFRYLIKN